MLRVLRGVLVALVVVATAGFVVGTTIERHNFRHESAAQHATETTAGESAGTSESAAHPKAEGGQQSTGETSRHPAAAGGSEMHKELRPLGIDIEAVPFVVLAALGSLGLAALGWSRPRWLLGLIAIVVAMTVFGALDVREVFHQSDENQTDLEVLAAVIAAMHFAAVGVAVAMAARRDAAKAAAATTAG